MLPLLVVRCLPHSSIVDDPSSPSKRKNGRAHDRRAKIRKTKQQQAGPGPSSDTYGKVLSYGTAIEVNAHATEFPAAKGAVTGKKGNVDELGDAIARKKFYTVVELVNEHGLARIPSDGRTPYPIIDCVGRIVAVLGGQPGGDYSVWLLDAHDAMKVEGAKAGLGKVSLDGDHLRGRFTAYNCRTTMGMGRDRAVIRMAQYQNFAFSLWAPRIYAEYVHVRDTVRSVLSLPKNFPNISVFAAAAFNFGGVRIWIYHVLWSFHFGFNNLFNCILLLRCPCFPFQLVRRRSPFCAALAQRQRHCAYQLDL
ncbi:hypothetical protein BT96DRAFT_1025390 [Gymnopus androsaceus JB14]|uniref:Uncharacterized protein n=1 Tax=Gymnopus androsaceus JB14 TaxID=1447944 RepID=A0A6A4GT24_9AGAR|nr:hypothetical protein BT96DRAFT_1025390 [Gymnopus androsaceus JB14]